MSTSEDTFPSFERGERLSTRGSFWTLIDMEHGNDGVALHLSGDAGHLRTLLAPFDRFRRVAGQAAPTVVRLPRWLRHVRSLAARNCRAGGLRAAAASRIRLFPYQLEPALSVLRHGATRLLIADGVGLGKTIQAGLLVAEVAQGSPAVRALILVPAGLRDQWVQELARLFDIAAVVADAGWIHALALERPTDANPWSLPGIYVASHDFVKRPEVLRPLEDVTWDLLVIDEAHACSPRTDRRAAAHAIAARSSRVVLLTATPDAGNPAELAALCSIGRVDPAEPPILLFRRSRQDVSAASARRSALLAVRTTADERRMHALLEKYTTAVWRESHARGDDLARLVAIVLRKRALSSATSLAVSVQRRIDLLSGLSEPVREQLRLPLGDEDPLEDDVPVAVLGAPGLVHAPRERRWLAAILEAAQRASQAESKARFLRKLLRRVHEPAIIFTEYRDTLIRLSVVLSANDRTLLLLHGGMSAVERSRVQRRFNEGGAVLLATDAAAEGLNLHARCRLIVHHELPWSVSRLEQRAGRVDRLGQDRRVHELGLVASATAERLVLEPLIRRANRARSSVGESHGLSATLTESHVAGMIVGGDSSVPLSPVLSPAYPPGTTRLMELGSEAVDEVRRLAAARECVERVPQPAVVGRAARTLISSIRRRRANLDEGIILVYLVSLTSPAGREVHIEPLVLCLEIDEHLCSRVAGRGSQVAGRRSEALLPRALRDMARSFARPADTSVQNRLEAAVNRALELAVPVYLRVEEELWRRHRAIERNRTSAARRLVQAGLFERRPAGQFVQRRERMAADGQPGLELPARAPTSVLCVDIALAAALRVLRR